MSQTFDYQLSAVLSVQESKQISSANFEFITWRASNEQDAMLRCSIPKPEGPRNRPLLLRDWRFAPKDKRIPAFHPPEDLAIDRLVAQKLQKAPRRVLLDPEPRS